MKSINLKIILTICLLVLLPLFSLSQVDKEKIKLKAKSKNVNSVSSIMVLTKSGGLFGIKKGINWIVKPAYDSLIWASKKEGFIIAIKNGLYGVINISGKEIVNFIYDEIEFLPEMSLYGVTTESGSGVISQTGKTLIEPIYESLTIIDSYRSIKENKGSVYAEKGNLNLIRAKTKSDKYYLYNNEGRKIYDYAFNGIDESSYNNAIIFKLNGKYGFFDESGVIRVEPIYSAVKRYTQGFAAVKEIGGWGFIDYFGNMTIPFQYSDANSFQEGLAGFKNPHTGKWGFLDSKGAWIIKPKYDEVCDFSEGKAFVSKENPYFCKSVREYFYGVIDLNENQILPFEYAQGSILRDMHFENGIACNVDKLGCDKEGYVVSFGVCCIDEKGAVVRKN